MELIERQEFLNSLQLQLDNTSNTEGHCVFVSGEAGIGKTALVKTFCKQNQEHCNIYHGACDALFTPRPLAPLYDILLQADIDVWTGSHSIEERSKLFLKFLHELSNRQSKTILIFEDIHWADEATLDFIKFFARRIARLKCLFILTYRDDEIGSMHPLRNVLGYLPPDSFTRMQLNPLSKDAVEKMAVAKGYKGEEVYSISAGNPFYVTEILSSYSIGIPDNIKDSVLSSFNRQEGKTKQVWELLSVVPASLEIKYLEKFEPLYAAAIENCMQAKILLINDEHIFFKHELFRKTIEVSLSPLKRIALNKNILDLLQESFEENKDIERIIHHAKNANEYETVVHFAPLAAKEAAAVGAHIEASKLYLTAIEYYQGNDKDILTGFYEAYAYECYLTNQVKEAIIYTGKSLVLRKEKNDKEKMVNCLRFLSRLWWFEGNQENAEHFGREAIEALKELPASKITAMAYSNMSQLNMLAGQSADCIYWGEKAIAIARELNDEETLSHALNNVGTVQMRIRSSLQKGIELLEQSLSIALKNSYHEHIARAYTNLGINAVAMKEYGIAKKYFGKGIGYAEEKDLDSWTNYMLAYTARMHMENGNWTEAAAIANQLLKKDILSPVVAIAALNVLVRIKMRRGDNDTRPTLLLAKSKAFEMKDMQGIITVLIALLEYEWITGEKIIEENILNSIIEKVKKSDNFFDYNEFAFWLYKARNQPLMLKEMFDGYDIENKTTAVKAAALWEKLGCPYEQAICLFEGTDENKKNALKIVHELGAVSITEKLKQEMRNSGIKRIPRGIRKATLANPVFLTNREIDVLSLLKEGLQNKEIADKLYLSAKTIDHHISSILFKLDVNSRVKAVKEAHRLAILK